MKRLNRINKKNKRIILKHLKSNIQKQTNFLIKLNEQAEFSKKGERDFNISLCLFLFVHGGHCRRDERFLKDVRGIV